MSSDAESDLRERRAYQSLFNDSVLASIGDLCPITVNVWSRHASPELSEANPKLAKHYKHLSPQSAQVLLPYMKTNAQKSYLMKAILS